MSSPLEDKSGWEVFGKICLTSLAIPVSLFLRMYVIQMLWTWFLADYIRVPSLPVCLGIGLMFNYLGETLPTRDLTAEEKQVEFKWWFRMVRTILYHLTVLLFGYVIHLFV